ncbi:MAG: hypothetical protein HFJ94_04925 [Muribaculaceae bacterium]|nr:hypothetical protein [Muribaculaceae bacterium]
MNEPDSLNNILQLAGVAVALLLCLIYIVRRITRSRHRKKNCDDCAGCPIADKCHNGGNRSSGCGCG